MTDGDGAIREASVIVAPPDTCPQCGTEHVPAYRTRTYERITWVANGWYHCPKCRFVWDTTWRIEPK